MQGRDRLTWLIGLVVSWRSIRGRVPAEARPSIGVRPIGRLWFVREREAGDLHGARTHIFAKCDMNQPANTASFVPIV